MSPLPDTLMLADNPALNAAGTAFQNLYYLGDYEVNGYDDSDGYVVFWDDESGKIDSQLFWTTRGGMGGAFRTKLQPVMSESILARLRAFIFDRDLRGMEFYENRRVMEPQPESLGKGARVRFLKSSRKGTKTPWVAGEVGECFWQGWYGTFYAKGGYNTKGRHNGRLGVKMADGRAVWCAMTSVRLDCEPDMAKCERQARQNAENIRIACPHAWWTNTSNQINLR